MTKPTTGERVTTQFGEAVFDGYCWVPADLHDALVQQQEAGEPDLPVEEGEMTEPLAVNELGYCSGCGAYWGNSIKGVTCVHCGCSVSLT